MIINQLRFIYGLNLDFQEEFNKETLNNSVFVLRNQLKILCSKIADDFLISNLRKFHKNPPIIKTRIPIQFVSDPGIKIIQVKFCCNDMSLP